MEHKNIVKPEILAPAGNKESFLAALAAGADAIYCGLKQFSARMESKNFSVHELKSLTEIARQQRVKVFVTLNSLLKPDETEQAGQIAQYLEKHVKPDALIVQDMGMIELARQAGFSGQIHLSTLANLSFPKALNQAKNNLKIDRVVIPRELNIDEIKAMASECPNGLTLEVFVHGALCYGVSGRCYWSSYMGGRSGLRGSCVQPCRRLYTQQQTKKRFFSCVDLSIDVLVKVLLSVPQISAWKIEGRKKSPHYVYYTVAAYKLLRDHGTDPKSKKHALSLLSMALGRQTTHFNFLPQRPQTPVKPDTQTGSGLLIGTVKGPKSGQFIIPRDRLLPNDVLRIGYEDQPWHTTLKIKRHIPAKGKFFIPPTGYGKSAGKTPANGTPVFLTDRREKALSEILSKSEFQIDHGSGQKNQFQPFSLKLPDKIRKKINAFDLHVYRTPFRKSGHTQIGLWLSGQALKDFPKHAHSETWWWLPPVIWPNHEKSLQALINDIQKNGAKNFVLNAPWQTVFFKHPGQLNLWAGPFCNTSNIPALKILKTIGFKGAVISPELGKTDYIQLPKQTPLLLGLVISGNWPVSVSRTIPAPLNMDQLFNSPRQEQAWVKKYDSDFWIYPNWNIDLRSKKNQLIQSGYTMFVNLIEPVPKQVKLKKRPGLWNWNIGLK